MWPVILTITVALSTIGVHGWHDPHCDGKQALVHLFEWRYSSIARECEEFLGPMGFCGVQISPPSENAVITSDYPRPWWERYQPISYKLTTRSGTEEELRDMVARCNAAGVRVFADVVINHMAGLGRTGTGTAGSNFDSSALDFPEVPFSADEFTPKDLCPSDDGNVNNYSDPDNVRNCYLVGLTDLYGAKDSVRDKVAAYLNNLIEIGIAGFRVDAAKHMWPEDIAGIQSRLTSLNTAHGFKQGSQPFFFHEVIDRNDGAVIVNEYFDLGRVTEFRYSQKIAWGINDFGNLGGVYDPGWGMASPEYAFVFVDNHDNQRGHGGAGDVVTHKFPELYKCAISFMLAHPYGFPRVMSSYYFGDDSSLGPPADDDYNTLEVTTNGDGSCGNGWVCEHRWNVIAKMVGFRNAVAGTEMANYWQEGDTVGFSRGNKGYFAMAKFGSLDKTVQTGMAAGEYCNIIDGCATKITVGGDGSARININDPENPVVAFCVGCDGGGVTIDPFTQEPTSPKPIVTEEPITSGVATTVVFIHKETFSGQDMFIRGGISHEQRPGCTEDAQTSACAIDMSINSLGTSNHYEKYDAWRQGDTKLDWYGVQNGQGSANGQQPEGTPLAWTSNKNGNGGYQELNTYGDHYWMVSFDMDCSQTEDGWFELKAFVTNGVGWESDISQNAACKTISPSSYFSAYFDPRAPYQSTNHMAMCGYVNVFDWDKPSCIIDAFP